MNFFYYNIASTPSHNSYRTLSWACWESFQFSQFPHRVESCTFACWKFNDDNNNVVNIYSKSKHINDDDEYVLSENIYYLLSLRVLWIILKIGQLFSSSWFWKIVFVNSFHISLCACLWEEFSPPSLATPD